MYKQLTQSRSSDLSIGGPLLVTVPLFTFISTLCDPDTERRWSAVDQAEQPTLVHPQADGHPDVQRGRAELCTTTDNFEFTRQRKLICITKLHNLLSVQVYSESKKSPKKRKGNATNKSTIYILTSCLFALTN